MKEILPVLIFAIASPVAAPFQIKAWTPSAAEVASVESKLRSDLLPHSLATAHREYAGKFDHDKKVIYGQLSWGWTAPGLKIASDGYAADIADGGCSVFNIRYDVASDTLMYAECGGLA